MSEKIQAFAIVVTDQKGDYSIHTSWKKACLEYGWQYNKNRPDEINGYKIIKHPIGVTIKCLELLELITRKNVEQTVEYYDGYDFTINIRDGKDSYIINLNASRYYEAEGEDGAGQTHGGYYAYCPEKIITVQIEDEDATEFKIDEYTEKKLLKFIDLDYYE